MQKRQRGVLGEEPTESAHYSSLTPPPDTHNNKHTHNPITQAYHPHTPAHAPGSATEPRATVQVMVRAPPGPGTSCVTAHGVTPPNVTTADTGTAPPAPVTATVTACHGRARGHQGLRVGRRGMHC